MAKNIARKAAAALTVAALPAAADATVHLVQIDAEYQTGSSRVGETLTAEFSYDDATAPNFISDPFQTEDFRQFFFNASGITSPLTVKDLGGTYVLNIADTNITANSFPKQDELLIRGQSAGQPYIEAYFVSTDTSFIKNGLPTSIPNISANIFGGYIATASGSASIRNIKFDAPASPIPEPATWAMMVGGFGLVGAALRSKRNRKVSTRATLDL